LPGSLFPELSGTIMKMRGSGAVGAELRHLDYFVNPEVIHRWHLARKPISKHPPAPAPR
jgi:hypothetical protein